MASLNTILSCSRIVVRSFLNGLYNSGSIEAPSTSAAGATTHACNCSSLVHPKSIDESPVIDKNHLTSKPKFLSARCGFAKDMLGGPSTARDQDVYGDDACFIASHRMADVVGVADGVGGWRTYGVDPSVFSRSLMDACSDLVRSGQFRPHLPAQLLASAYQKLHFKKSPEPGGGRMVGSSTACVVVLDKCNNELHTANLGDSGFLVLRGGRIVHRSVEQQHYFNAPFQLSLPPEEEHNFVSDSPDSAETSTFRTKEGDIIVVATDGLFDNMPTSLIEKQMEGIEKLDLVSLQAVCNSLALQARRLAFDQEFLSPFAEKARSHGYRDVAGGKPDDITVLLAVVTVENLRPPPSEGVAGQDLA